MPKLKHAAGEVVFLNVKLYGGINALVVYLVNFNPNVHLSKQFTPSRTEKVIANKVKQQASSQY